MGGSTNATDAGITGQERGGNQSQHITAKLTRKRSEVVSSDLFDIFIDLIANNI